MKNIILLIVLIVSNLALFAQKKYKIIGLTSESEVYMKIESVIDGIDYDAKFNSDSYNFAVKDTLIYHDKNVILLSKNQKLKDLNSNINQFQNSEIDRKDKKELQKNINKQLRENSNKSFDGSVSSFISLYNFDYNEEFKKNSYLISQYEEQIKGNNKSILNIKNDALFKITSNELEIFPKVQKNILTLVKIPDLTLIKGAYLPKEYVRISKVYDIRIKKQKGEFLSDNDVKYVNADNINLYYWYQNIDKTGIDFYSLDGTLLNKNLLDIDALPVEKKRTLILECKSYLSNMNKSIDVLNTIQRKHITITGYFDTSKCTVLEKKHYNQTLKSINLNMDKLKKIMYSYEEVQSEIEKNWEIFSRLSGYINNGEI